MVKGSFITPFLLGSKCSDSKEDQSQPAAPSRMSTSSRFPSLRRLETSSSDTGGSSSRPTSLPNRLKPESDTPADSSSSSANALLHLKFSGPSFLDVVAKDRETKEPMYIIETVRDTTTVYRLDQRTKEAIRAACVQWPQSIVKGKTSGRTVQMGNGRWRDTEEFLKYGTLANFANRKFNIPHWPHALKWKLVPGNSYVCTTQDIRGPIAILDAAVLSAPPRLRIYHNFMNGDAERSQRENIKGVPVILLDYLMTTALILVTEVQEWLDRPQSADGRLRIPGSSQPAVQKWLAIIHGESVPESPGPSSSGSPTLTAVSANWDESSNRHSSGTASLSSGPITPLTPASSALGHSTPFSAREEEVPPVPPLPEAVRAAHPGSPPQTYATFDSLSSVMTPSSSSTSSVYSPALPSQRGKRPLPTPPGLSSSSLSAPRPWTSQGDGPTPSPSTTSFERERPASPASSSSSTSNSRRSRVGRSLTIANIPPLQPPPSSALPLPPKLAQELGGRTGESSAAGTSVLQAVNPDPLPPDEEERLRRNIQALTIASQPPAPPLPPIMPYTYNPHEPMRDAGAISMVDASRRRSYAETVYEQPPPAYDAIDFSLPQLHLPRR